MQNIGKEEHFARSLATSEYVLPLIENAVSKACREVPVFKAQCDVFLHRRRNAVMRGRPMLRPYLARCLYELGDGKDWRTIAPALAAVELHNISTYQANLSFDGKIDWPHAETSSHNQVMAAMLSLSSAHALLDGLRENGAADRDIASCCQKLQDANGAVYLGQYLDLNVLHANAAGIVEQWDEARYLREYVLRCRLMGGGTFTVILIGFYLSPEGRNTGVAHALSNYLESLGAGTQVTNDLGDYYLPESRPYSVSFMDLRRGRLTLPTFQLLSERFGPALAIRRGGSHPRSRDYQACVDRLRELGLYRQARALLETEVWSVISQAFSDMREMGVDDSKLSPLTFARPFLFSTKYVRYFKQSDSNIAQQERGG